MRESLWGHLLVQSAGRNFRQLWRVYRSSVAARAADATPSNQYFRFVFFRKDLIFWTVMSIRVSRHSSYARPGESGLPGCVRALSAYHLYRAVVRSRNTWTRQNQ
jgi:hypothetical protein